MQQETKNTIMNACTVEVWKDIISQYEKKIIHLDVRGLEMPWPMMNILSALSQMNHGNALHILHGRIPHLLLPELNIRGYTYRIKENEGLVEILIFKEIN